MAKLDYFVIHVETEEDWAGIGIELQFACEDHITTIDCDCVDDTADISRLFVCLKTLFEEETSCSYEVKQYIGGFRHKVSIFGAEVSDPSFSFDCDRIEIKERDN